MALSDSLLIESRYRYLRIEYKYYVNLYRYLLGRVECF